MEALQGAFNFGKWEELTMEHSLMYCGGKIKMTVDGVSLSYADYLKKVHPITVPKGQGELHGSSPARILPRLADFLEPSSGQRCRACRHSRLQFQSLQLTSARARTTSS